jgi:hypothetical protein
VGFKDANSVILEHTYKAHFEYTPARCSRAQHMTTQPATVGFKVLTSANAAAAAAATAATASAAAVPAAAEHTCIIPQRAVQSAST